VGELGLPVASPATSADLLALLDARIRFARTRRANCERFCEAYWEADDDLAWLRMVRDEVARTGIVRPEVAAMAESTAVALGIDGADVSAVASSAKPAGRKSAAAGRLERVAAGGLAGAA
jgi:hypothetical protein